MRIVAIGDVGVVDSMMHIGDEAMFEEFLDQARIRGVDEVLVISAQPDETANRYGIESLPRLGLVGDRAAMLERARAIVDGSIDEGDPARTTMRAVASADKVVVTGAGNLASTWPAHIIERWALSRLAAAAGIPFVVSGQTLGPELTADDATLLTEMLDSAELVGVRESASLALARRLGITHAVQTVDDASFLKIDEPTPAAPAIERPYCLVSLSTHVGVADRVDFQTSVAALLDAIAESTGLGIVFYAHFGPLDGEAARGDVVMHRAVAALMSSPTDVVETGDSDAAAWLARRASLVVSSRYHPAVFAVSAGVPTLGIAVDEYTTVKLTGALGNFGQDAVVSAADVISGGAVAVSSAIWQARDEIRERSIEIADARRHDSVGWWDRVIGAQG